ncbi:MAG: hypothetical protein DWQ37_08540 [Planctomycetota bacterium]|nr:MAG: hypothetical protein DWQ37_08540 [Planctomycetota bacterium]
MRGIVRQLLNAAQLAKLLDKRAASDDEYIGCKRLRSEPAAKLRAQFWPVEQTAAEFDHAHWGGHGRCAGRDAARAKQKRGASLRAFFG